MKKYIALMAGMLASTALMALDLPEQIGNYMVLQQQTNARLWGWAKPDAKVSVKTSWNNKNYSATADKSGRWELQVQTPAASYNEFAITVKGDGETRTLQHVLIGEVWFCSGQSNMEMPLQGFWNCPVEGSNETIAQANRFRKSIRCATIAKNGPDEPQERAAGTWKECTTENASLFSACGYYFAETLTQLLDVPVGIINCSWGGSCVEGWLPKDTLLTYHDGLTPCGTEDYHRKMVMYNGMLHPLAGYTIKGFLWNQGESNINRENEYIDRFITMTRLWRKMWRQEGDPLPMYTVELPGYSYGDVNGTNCADFRAAQHAIAHQLENSGCVSTADLMLPYEAEQIHGAKKREIGQRLAYMAASRNYNMRGLVAEAPEFREMKIIEADANAISVIAGTPVAKNANDKGKVVCLYFDNCTDGFDRLSDIEHFEAAGADGIWHKAIVWADSEWQDPDPSKHGCYLKLVCPEVPEVLNVRYHYHNFIVGGLRSSRGLPIVPFCTQNTPKCEVSFSDNSWVWQTGDKVQATIKLNDKLLKRTGHDSLVAIMRKDTGEEVRRQKLDLQSETGDITLTMDVSENEPGFYHLFVEWNGENIVTNVTQLYDKPLSLNYYRFGISPEQIVSAPDAQPDFKRFWDKARAQLKATPLKAKVREVTDRQGDKRCFIAEVQGLGGDIVQIDYTVPKKPGKYPLHVLNMGYSSQPWDLDLSDNGWIDVIVSSRGQGRNQATNRFGDWVQFGLESPEHYYYRGAYLDCSRAIDYLLTLPEADGTQIFLEGGSQGGAYSMACAALDHRVTAVACYITFMSDFPDYFRIVEWPYNAISSKQQELGLTDEQVYRTLSYFDIKNLAQWIECPVYLGIGLQDITCPPHTNIAGYNLLKGDKQLHFYRNYGHHVDYSHWTPTMYEFYAKYRH